MILAYNTAQARLRNWKDEMWERKWRNGKSITNKSRLTVRKELWNRGILLGFVNNVLRRCAAILVTSWILKRPVVYSYQKQTSLASPCFPAKFDNPIRNITTDWERRDTPRHWISEFKPCETRKFDNKRWWRYFTVPSDYTICRTRVDIKPWCLRPIGVDSSKCAGTRDVLFWRSSIPLCWVTTLITTELLGFSTN
jgi:hypothetical protein